jgi:hypothetical protein
MDHFRCSSDFVALGFQFAYRRRPDPLATRCGIGRSGDQLTERTTKRSLRKDSRVPTQADAGASLMAPTLPGLQGWVKAHKSFQPYFRGRPMNRQGVAKIGQPGIS